MTLRRLCLLATAALALVAPAALADTEPSPTPSKPVPEAPLAVLVTQLLPRAPQPQDAVEVQGLLRNLGSTTITDIQVRLRIGSPVRTRSGLHDADNDRPVTESRSVTATAPAATSLAPGAGTRFTIRTTVRLLGLSQLGVYPLDVEARGNAGDGFHPLGLAPTWLPFFAGLHVQPTRVAVVWPLVDRPRQRANGTFSDDDLATSLSSTGRLGRLLAAGDSAATPQCDPVLAPTTPGATPTTAGATPATPGGKPATTTAKPAVPRRCERVLVTYAVDPDLLLAAKSMSGNHRVERTDKTVTEKAVSAASAWLSGLSRSASRNGLIALPYGDPDVTAMTRPAQTRLHDGLLDDLSRDMALSRSAVGDTLGVTPLQNVAWPPAGVVTSAAADLLSRDGARALVLDTSAYDQPETDPRRSPSARTPLPSTTGIELEGLVADPYLSDLVSGDLSTELGPRLAEQRFLAESAIIAAEAPSLSRTLVIAPERRGDVNVAAATGALRDLGRVPWLCPVTLTSVADDRERCVDHPDAPTPPAEDRGLLRTSRDDELSAGYLSQVAVQRQRAIQLADAVLTDRTDPAVTPAVTSMRADLHRAVARTLSSAWRDDPQDAMTSLLQLRDDLDALIGQVSVRGGHVLLTSNTGQIQVRVSNQLDVPISVRVRFSSRTLGLLTAESPLVDVAPDNALAVSVKATAQRSGQFFVDAHLVDRNGDDFGTPTVVNGRSTRYGRLALALTLGAGGVLLIAAAARLVRRALRRAA